MAALACSVLGGCIRLLIDRCESDSDCSTGQACLEHECKTPERKFCLSSADCDVGMVCSLSFHCVPDVPDPPRSCTWSGECLYGERCLLSGGSGVCDNSTTCNTERDCGFPYVCTDGTCVTRRCSGDAECAPFRCLNTGSTSTCATKCTDATHCVAGARCEYPLCTTRPQCSTPEDCEGYRCFDGTCLDDCYHSEDACSEGYECWGYGSGCGRACSTGSTSACAPYVCENSWCLWNCSEPLDCVTGFVCLDRHCVPAACESDAVCRGFRCIGGACTGSCKVGTDCAEGYACNNQRCVLPG